MYEIIQSETFRKWSLRLRDERALARIYTRLRRMSEGSLGDVKPVGEGISEVRIRYGPGYRLYFMQKGPVIIVMLCGGDKGSQQRDIIKAKQLAKEWRQ